MKPVCLFAHDWHYLPLYDDVAQKLETEGVTVHFFIGAVPNAAYHQKLKDWRNKYPHLHGFERSDVRSRFIAWLIKVPVFGYLLAALAAYGAARAFLKRENIGSVIVSDDRAFWASLFLTATQSLHIPAVLYPTENLQFVERMIIQKATIMPKPTLLRRILWALVKKWYPADVRTFEGKDAFFHQVSFSAPLLLWRQLLPPNPWIRGSHTALTKIAVNSELQKQDDIADGMNPKKIVVTGFPPHDRFHLLMQNRDALRKQFAEEYGISFEKLFVVAGTHFRGVYDSHDLPNVQQELRDLFTAMEQNVPADYLIVIKLHPAADPEEWRTYYDVLKRPFLVTKPDWDAYRLTAIADGICMFASSLVMAALVTDIPILVCKLRLTIFDDFFALYESVQRIYDAKENAPEALRNLTPRVTGELLAKRQRDRNTLGMFDGHNTERCIEILRSV